MKTQKLYSIYSDDPNSTPSNPVKYLWAAHLVAWLMSKITKRDYKVKVMVLDEKTLNQSVS